MRIVHVVRQFHPGLGGLENFVLCLAREQLRQGHAVRVVTLDRLSTNPDQRLPAHETLGGIEIARIRFRGSARYPVAPGVLRHVEDADIVHVHGVDFFCDFLALTRMLHGKPLVLSTHGGFFHTPFARRLKQVFFSTVTRLSLTAYQRVLACSSNDMELFRSVGGNRLMLINNGVDTAKFADAASPTFRPSLVYLGRLASHKGLSELVATFGHIADARPDAELHIVGNDWDGVLPALREQIAAMPQGHRIRLHAGVGDERVAGIMRGCSFVVSASRYEGFGLTMVEAMAAGLVPVANRITSFQSIVADAGVGLVTGFAEPARAAAEILAFIDDTEAHWPARREAARRASRQYDWETTARRIGDEYDRILGVGRREILGVALDVTSSASAVASIDDAIESGRLMKVAFANAHTLNLAATRPELRQALSRFVVLNDGVGVDLASLIRFGRRFEENLNGTDFVPHYLKSSRHRLRIYLLGATQEVVEAAARRFAQRFPQHTIVGARNGFLSSPEATARACQEIRRSRADIVLVGMGNPLQELWIDANGPATGAKVLLGVGALFDFTAGAVPRAPAWVQTIRCEWLFRMAQEPRRLWRRYLIGNAMFLLRVLRQPAVSPAP